MKSVSLYIKKDKEFSLLKGHPWVFREAVKTIPDSLQTGDEVEVLTHKGMFIGKGFLDLSSNIIVRMVEGDYEMPLDKIMEAGIRKAFEFRKKYFQNLPTDGYRLLNGEGDGLPGLVIDRYANAAAIHTYSDGLIRYLPVISGVLKMTFKTIETAFHMSHKHAEQHSSGILFGQTLPSAVQFTENGIKFEVNLLDGQKTGFFLDQRENRAFVRGIARGLKVANICGYTGAFTVAAAKGGALESVTVDCTEPVLKAALRNFKLNGLDMGRHRVIKSDMHDFLKSIRPGSFDLIILDPPALSRNQKNLPAAMNYYRRINSSALSALSSGGFLFTSSCTSRMSQEMFLSMIMESAAKASVRAKIIHESAHAIDHPIALAQPEGRYLKSALIEVTAVKNTSRNIARQRGSDA